MNKEIMTCFITILFYYSALESDLQSSVVCLLFSTILYLPWLLLFGSSTFEILYVPGIATSPPGLSPNYHRFDLISSLNNSMR